MKNPDSPLEATALESFRGRAFHSQSAAMLTCAFETRQAKVDSDLSAARHPLVNFFSRARHIVCRAAADNLDGRARS
ncbi:MAG: hypothetical protein QOF61_476 [Acidobacteriota bacterium]|jgi:hypothetical protein|nr:hypothetical protein [Acidobacteriota bacterium]